MARYQLKKRGFFSLDTAAFCDVAFLMLAFFMLTNPKAKDYLNTQVNAPAIKSTPYCTMNGEYDLKIVFTLDKKCFIEFPYADTIKEITLFKLGKQKGIAFTKAEAAKFAAIDRFGVPIAALKSLINGYTSQAIF